MNLNWPVVIELQNPEHEIFIRNGILKKDTKTSIILYITARSSLGDGINE